MRLCTFRHKAHRSPHRDPKGARSWLGFMNGLVVQRAASRHTLCQICDFVHFWCCRKQYEMSTYFNTISGIQPPHINRVCALLPTASVDLCYFDLRGETHLKWKRRSNQVLGNSVAQLSLLAHFNHSLPSNGWSGTLSAFVNSINSASEHSNAKPEIIWGNGAFMAAFLGKA